MTPAAGAIASLWASSSSVKGTVHTALFDPRSDDSSVVKIHFPTQLQKRRASFKSALCSRNVLCSWSAKQSLLGSILGGIPDALLNCLNGSHPLNQCLEVPSEGF